jgi:hypothetical protein
VFTKPNLSCDRHSFGAHTAELDLTRFQMARLLGTNMATWGTYEAGLKRIPPDQALKLSPYGIPLDWIYRGSMTGLHPHIRAKIIKEQADRRSRRGRRAS